MGDQLHAENLPGKFSGFFHALGDLYSATLAAAAGMNLGFDNQHPCAAAQKSLGDSLGGFGGVAGAMKISPYMQRTLSARDGVSDQKRG